VIIADALTDSLLAGILLVAISSAVGLWGRTRKLEQAMFNGVEKRLDKLEELLDWLYKDTLYQAREIGRRIPTPLPDDTAEQRIDTERARKPT
jgi:hypothetical protein